MPSDDVVFAIVSGSDDDCDRDTTGICDAILGTAENAALVWAPLTGALVEALAGTLLVSERWVPAVHPGGAGGAVALRWTLPARVGPTSPYGVIPAP